jgi:hypothetical protein
MSEQQCKKIQIAMQKDPSRNANGPNSNAIKTNHARGVEQAKQNSTYKLTKL